MGRLTVAQYDALERAIVDARRVAIHRRGTEYIVVPERLTIVNGRESLQTRHPTTGAHLTLPIDEIDRFEVVR